MQLYAKYSVKRGFRATLNFRKFKVSDRTLVDWLKIEKIRKKHKMAQLREFQVVNCNKQVPFFSSKSSLNFFINKLSSISIPEYSTAHIPIVKITQLYISNWSFWHFEKYKNKKGKMFMWTAFKHCLFQDKKKIQFKP